MSLLEQITQKPCASISLRTIPLGELVEKTLIRHCSSQGVIVGRKRLDGVPSSSTFFLNNKLQEKQLAVSEALIKKCMEGDRRSQNELYKYCYSFLISVCWRYATSKDEAVEYMNLGFVKILTNLGKRQEDVPFENWCRRIMINNMIDEYRKSRNYSKHVKVVEHERLPVGADTADLSDLQMDLVDLIKSKVPMLPPMTAKVFNLYAIDGYKHQEIAELLQISEGTSMWHYSEAKRRIRDMISFK